MKLKIALPIISILTILLSGFVQTGEAKAAVINCEKYHTVQRGEYLVKIAKLYEVSWRWLADVNDLTNPSRIYPGQKICVEFDDTPMCVREHIVQRGEYLSKIAGLYGVSWQWLADINELSDPSRIYPGQRLCIDFSINPVCTDVHVVQRGEYLSKIARKYNVSWRWLAEINDLKKPSLIFPGQEICVALSAGD